VTLLCPWASQFANLMLGGVPYWHVIIRTYCMLYFVYAYLSRLAHYANPESTHIQMVCMNKQNKRLQQHTTGGNPALDYEPI